MNRLTQFLALGSCLLALIFSNGVRAEDSYPYYMGQCALAKQAGDMAGVENAVLKALQYGPGDEYAWRTLAWAQGKQGKWPESLTNALENVRRNGASGWSLAQLADSALGNEDFALARKTLKQSDTLPRGSLHGSEVELRHAYDRLRAATAERTYDLRFKIDLKQGGPQKKPVWLLIPQMNTDQQTFSFEVTNAVSYQTRHVGIHDYIEVVQKPGEALYVDGKLTLKPFCLGARLNHVPAGECPEDLKPYLTKFQNVPGGIRNCRRSRRLQKLSKVRPAPRPSRTSSTGSEKTFALMQASKTIPLSDNWGPSSNFATEGVFITAVFLLPFAVRPGFPPVWRMAINCRWMTSHSTSRITAVTVGRRSISTPSVGCPSNPWTPTRSVFSRQGMLIWLSALQIVRRRIIISAEPLNMKARSTASIPSSIAKKSAAGWSR